MSVTDPSTMRPIHPLFRNTSLYRLAADESLFAEDNGERSVRDFFQARRRVKNYSAWLPDADPLPEVPLDWGLGRPVDEAIHRYLEDQASPPEPVSGIRRHALADAGADGPTPALLLYRLDLEGDAANPTLSRETGDRAQFTGCGTPPGSLPWKQFSALIRDLPDDHVCLLMIFTRSQLRLLKALQDPNGYSTTDRLVPAEIRSEDEALATINWALTATTLDSRQPRLRALRVSTQLALAPALQRTTRNGCFVAEVKLDLESPPLDLWTWVVVCVGPPVEAFENGRTS